MAVISYVCVCVCAQARACVCVPVRMCVCVHESVYVHTHAYMCVYVLCILCIISPHQPKQDALPATDPLITQHTQQVFNDNKQVSLPMLHSHDIRLPFSVSKISLNNRRWLI